MSERRRREARFEIGDDNLDFITVIPGPNQSEADIEHLKTVFPTSKEDTTEDKTGETKKKGGK